MGSNSTFWDHLQGENVLACRSRGPSEFNTVCTFVSQYLAAIYLIVGLYLFALFTRENKLFNGRSHRSENMFSKLRIAWARHQYKNTKNVGITIRSPNVRPKKGQNGAKVTLVSGLINLCMALQLASNGGHTIDTPNTLRGMSGDIFSAFYVIAHSYNSYLQNLSSESFQAWVDDGDLPSQGSKYNQIVEILNKKGTPLLLLIMLILLTFELVTRSSVVTVQLLLLGIWSARSLHSMITRRAYAMNRVVDLQVKILESRKPSFATITRRRTVLERKSVEFVQDVVSIIWSIVALSLSPVLALSVFASSQLIFHNAIVFSLDVLISVAFCVRISNRLSKMAKTVAAERLSGQSHTITKGQLSPPVSYVLSRSDREMNEPLFSVAALNLSSLSSFGGENNQSRDEGAPAGGALNTAAVAAAV